MATASRAGSEMPRSYKNGTYTPSVMSSHMTEFSLPSIASTNTNASNYGGQNENRPYSSNNMGPGSVQSTSAMSTDSSMPTTPHRISQPSSQANTPQRVLNQMAANTQSSTDQTLNMTIDQVERILPEILRHLHDPDEQVFSRAASITSKLVKNPTGFQAIIQSTNIITALLRLVDTNKTSNLPLTQKSIAKVIYEISEEKASGAARQGIQVLVKNGAIRTIMILLVSNNPTIQSYSVSSLHNILQFANTPAGKRMRNNRQFDIKKMVREEGGTERLTLLLKNSHNKFLAICADSLWILAHNSPESKIRILQARGLEELIRIMANSTYNKLLNPCSRVLKVLSTCKHNKEQIVRLGGMQALGRHLANTTPQTAKLVQCCLWALRNLSDVATKQPNMDGVLKLLLDRVNNGDELTVQCAAGALMNLTCNNQVNKQIVFQTGGVDIIIRQVIKTRDHNILEPLLSCLRNMSCRHPEAYNAALSFRSHYGLRQITEMLQLTDQPNWNLIKPIISICRNLLTNAKECQSTLRTLGCIPHLTNLIRLAKSYLDPDPTKLPKVPWTTNIRPDNTIRPEEIITATCDALNLIAKDETNRDLLMRFNVIPTLCKILRHHVPSNTESILQQNRCYGKGFKFEASLAEQVCTSAGHVLLTMRRDDQARELCKSMKVDTTLDQFQRYVAQKEAHKQRQRMRSQNSNSQPGTPVSSRSSNIMSESSHSRPSTDSRVPPMHGSSGPGSNMSTSSGTFSQSNNNNMQQSQNQQQQQMQYMQQNFKQQNSYGNQPMGGQPGHPGQGMADSGSQGQMGQVYQGQQGFQNNMAFPPGMTREQIQQFQRQQAMMSQYHMAQQRPSSRGNIPKTEA